MALWSSFGDVYSRVVSKLSTAFHISLVPGSKSTVVYRHKAQAIAGNKEQHDPNSSRTWL